ncbi:MULTISPECIES: DUF4214 domain-containing protein [Nitrospirillum]|uniref:DUF4214 domain-containing protein n=1 Tax=Nitrospirillum amazonense TaxID=28077 RepID=UPI0011A68AC5|nr:DUF4214 domain-containing protein [Nitrospirillum amazonense]MEC4590399.1 DUF4214 domain-containing protein [Nitrospirillum amazonense]
MVEEILKFHDKEFIDLAYQNIVGRFPGSHEVNRYRNMLRSGVDKRAVLLEIWQSEPIRRSLLPELDRALTALQTEMKRERGFRGKMERGRRLEQRIHQIDWKISDIRQTFDELSEQLTRLGVRVDNVGQEIHERTYPSFVQLQQSADEFQRSIDNKLGALEARVEGWAGQLEPVVCFGGSASIASMADLPGGAQRLVRRVRSLTVR